MLQSIVDAALRAVATSLVLGVVLALLVALATRMLPLRAATRHLLWTTALIAIALMPLAGIAVSLGRAYAPMPDSSTAMVTPNVSPQTRIATHVRRQTGPASSSPTHVRAGAPPFVPTIPGQAPRFVLPRFHLPHLSRGVATTIVAIWALGAVLGLGGLALSLVRVRGLKRRSSPLDAELSDQLPWLTDVTRTREIYLRLSCEIETPVAIGFRRPVILIPTELATQDGLTAIEPLVVHEYAHLRRHDDWTNLVQRAIERIFWFNPLVWVLGRRIVLEREVAADDAVVDRTGDAKGYATALWRLAREMRMPEHAVVAPGALLTRKQISLRIERLLAGDRSRLRRSPVAAFGVVLAAGAAVAVVATSAPAVELPMQPIALASPVALASPIALATTVPLADLRHLTPALKVAAAHGAQSATVKVQSFAKVRAATTAATTAPKIAPGYADTAAHVTVRRLPNVRAQDAAASAGAQAAAGAAAGAAAAASSAQRTVHSYAYDYSALGHEIAQEVRSAFDDADLGTTGDRGPALAGRRLTRELVAGCKGCSLRDTDLRGLDLHGLNLTGVDFHGANLSDANLSGATLIGCDFHNADLRGANFNGARLNGVSLRGARVGGTTLRGLASACTGCELRSLDLRGADLHGIRLTGADLRGVDLRGANLSGASLTGVDLTDAHLDGADLTNARLTGCDLSGVSFDRAKTAGMRLVGSDLDD